MKKKISLITPSLRKQTLKKRERGEVSDGETGKAINLFSCRSEWR